MDPSQTIARHRAGLNNLQVVRPMLAIGSDADIVL